MVKYELHYFDTRGTGEPIRLLFAYTNTPYEDVRITAEQWPDVKSNYNSMCPKVIAIKIFVSVDGQELAQSAAILRYLAEKFGLAGKDEWEKAKVHEVVDFHKDVCSDLASYFYDKIGYIEGDTAALRKDVFLPNAERLFPQYVRLLKESGSGFLAPSGLTFVDFLVADYFEYWTSQLEPEFMKENYPEIVAFVERVYSLPQIHKYPEEQNLSRFAQKSTYSIIQRTYKMVKYELHYFDTRRLGEAIRLLFAYTNTPFEDVRITWEQWPDRKPTYKFGKVPVLKVDGQELAQSAAILRYLAEKFGLAGKDEWEKAKVHEVADFHKDVAALRKDIFLPNAERLFPQYVRLLKESGSGFLAPSGLTFVDFSVAHYFEYWINKLEPEFMKLQYHPTDLQKLSKMVKYEVHYFDDRGLAEPIRLLFAYTNTPFEDVRFTREQWADRKSTYKFGKVPVLKVDGQELAQSAAILRYLAEKFGLAGKDEWERAKVHEVADFHKDVAALRKDVFLPNAERLFPQYVRLLNESDSGFLAPSGLTFVDFSVAHYFEYWISKLEPEFMKQSLPLFHLLFSLILKIAENGETDTETDDLLFIHRFNADFSLFSPFSLDDIAKNRDSTRYQSIFTRHLIHLLV
ncbi:putative glutathione S-transferase 5 [Ditylenchus destructor]|nr:putative glutathione S-transferase 5 [Ditylenchus destructor]